MPNAIEHPSPNYGPRRDAARPDMVVIHYTGMVSATAALARLSDPAAEVSAHYLIAEGGTIWRLVPEEMRAWHAGEASWGGVSDVNSHSIGIELANPGPDARHPPFAEPQMRALEGLLAEVMDRHSIPPERVVGHACVAPARKADPGSKFDWRRLARQGLAIWLEPARGEEGGAADPLRFQRAAARFGYAVPQSGGWCAATLAVWRAFAMRFLPGRASGRPSGTDVSHLERLAERWPARPGATVND